MLEVVRSMCCIDDKEIHFLLFDSAVKNSSQWVGPVSALASHADLVCFFLNCFVIILKFSSFFKSQEICNDPVQCKERHVYCSVCIRDWLRTHKTCPMGYALTVETLERTRALKDIIDDKEIYFLLFDSHAGYALRRVLDGRIK